MRAMTLEDLDAVFAIEQAVQAYPWTQNNFLDALNSGYLCCVDEAESGEICCYAILMLAANEGELLNIGVATTRQRNGYGRALLSEVLNIARVRQVHRLFLEVRPSNLAAIALYRSTGFSEIGIRRGYYRNAGGCDDAMTMACDLTGEANG